MPRFEACVESEKYGPAIRRDITDAQTATVSGTPSFVLGKTSKQGAEGVLIVGAQPFGNFEDRIRKLLGK